MQLLLISTVLLANARLMIQSWCIVSYPDFLNQRKYIVADHAYFTAGVSVKNAGPQPIHAFQIQWAFLACAKRSDSREVKY